MTAISFGRSRGLLGAALVTLLLSSGGCARAPVREGPPSPLPASINLQWAPTSCPGRFLDKHYFIVCYDGPRRLAFWVSYHSSADLLTGTTPRSDSFYVDTALPPAERADLGDYAGSGFDRGHLAPAGDFKISFEAMRSTFVLSNIAPQRPHLNQGRWRILEEEVRQLTRAHGSTWIITGLLFLDHQGLPSQPFFSTTTRLPVPTHFYKAIFCEHPSGKHELYAFLMPNLEAGIAGPSVLYAVSVDRVEALTGLDFFAALDDSLENAIERDATTTWPVSAVVGADGK